MINDKLSIVVQKIWNNMCKHPKSAIFYLALFIFTIWGSLTSFHLICQYVEKTKEPKSLLNLYIYRDGVASLYRNLVFLFILNGLGITSHSSTSFSRHIVSLYLIARKKERCSTGISARIMLS